MCIAVDSFKPYYKWITLNTMSKILANHYGSIGFKPYYKWITLNTKNERMINMNKAKF